MDVDSIRARGDTRDDTIVKAHTFSAYLSRCPPAGEGRVDPADSYGGRKEHIGQGVRFLEPVGRFPRLML